jgi:multiple sugar transport system permease protein
VTALAHGSSPAARKRRRVVLAFLAPWLAGFAVFAVYPLVTTFWLSFTNSDMISPARFVGLRNYRYLFGQDPYIGQAVRNTLWLVAIMVPAQVLFALGVALVTARLKGGAGIWRTLFYLPALAPPVAATVAFVCLFNPGTGPVDHLLHTLGLPQPLWFDSTHWSKPALTLLALWGIGDLMVIFMAALLDVPQEQYEAAELDGASAWQRFRFVTLPNISPIVMFAVVTGVIQTMQYYTQPLIAGKVASGVIQGAGTQFEPGYPEKSTLTLPQLVYNLGFQRFDYGSACVVALVLFALSMVFTAFLMRRRGGLNLAGD